MFTAELIKERLREKPFRPLRIIASEGLRFDIHHPDLVMVLQRDLMIGVPTAVDSGIYSRVIRVALVHIVALEELPSAATPQGDGPSGNGPLTQ